MVKIEVSGTRGTVFDHGDFEVTISPLLWNKYMKAYVFNLEWRVKGILKAINGIAVASGVNLMIQYCDAPLKSLWALSSIDLTKDIQSLEDLTFYIE